MARVALRAWQICLLGACICAALAGWQGVELLRIAQYNHRIAGGSSEADASAPPRVRFAAAYSAARKGDSQAALNRYRELQQVSDPQVRRDAKFNSGNLYMQQTLAQRADVDASAALTLVELAKQSYRDLLRDDAADWDGRYNLEKALRIAPDPEEDSEAMATPPSRLRTPTTGEGRDLGLP